MQTHTAHTPSSRPATAAGRHLVLRPGVHVLRRSAGELQVGFHPSRALVLPDHPRVRAVLAALTSPASMMDEQVYDDRTLTLLAGSGLLVDADTLLPLVPTGPAAREKASAAGSAPSPGLAAARSGAMSRGAQRVDRAAVAALALDAGDHVPAFLEARSAAAVGVITTGERGALKVAAALTDLLRASGLYCQEYDEGRRPQRPGSPQREAASAAAGPTAVVVVAVGEAPRERVDDLVRSGTPHLLLRLTEGHAVVGPFVLPGETACLRCIDAHHTDVDPAWPLLVTQYATAASHEREDTLPEPVDPLLATLASAWAARELVSFAEGRHPATASTTVRLDPHLTALETQHWPRHPACGCAWA